jgi:hypothetical protein
MIECFSTAITALDALAFSLALFGGFSLWFKTASLSVRDLSKVWSILMYIMQ